MLGWAEAEETIRRTDFAQAWWDAEERIGRELTRAAAAALGRDTMEECVARIGRRASDILQTAADNALSAAGRSDAGLGKSAAGSAAMAVHHATLALAAGCDGGHPFAVKFRLFQAGRWPLGVYGDGFYLL